MEIVFNLLGAFTHSPLLLPTTTTTTTTTTARVNVDGARMDKLVRSEFGLLGRSVRFPIPNAHKLGLNPYYR